MLVALAISPLLMPTALTLQDKIKFVEYKIRLTLNSTNFHITNILLQGLPDCVKFNSQPLSYAK
jgi:hypothetical protein